VPVTITPQTSTPAVGPGLPLTWTSDFIGPLNTTAFWRVNYASDAEGLKPVFKYELDAHQSPSGGFTMFVNAPRTVNVEGQFQLTRGQQTHVIVELVENSVVIDSGSSTIPWDDTAGLGLQLQTKPTGQGSGLTTEQAKQLSDINVATAVSNLVNTITLTDLTQGPSSGPINAFLPDLVFGVIVRLASVPSDLQPQTPDGNYWVKTLATVRIFRGSDLWLRVPIHTSNKLVSFWQENLLVGLSAVTGLEWILQLSVQVDFLPGVTGEVFLMHFP